MASNKLTKRKRILAINLLVQSLDSDSDDDLLTIVSNHYQETKTREKRSRIAITNYVESVAYQYDVNEFKSHFRLQFLTYQYLLQILAPSLKEKNPTGVGRHTHPPDTQLLVALSMLANQEVYRLIAEKFNISKSTAWLYVRKVCGLVADLASNYICWPTAPQLQKVMNKFKERHGFPGVLGAVDGSHITITPPLEQQIDYCNRKGYHSIILQAVCNASYLFTDVFIGYPGSVHDARVFRNSPLGRKIIENPEELFPPNTHILGDSAYTCSNYVLTPYRDNGHLTRQQKNYNFKHSSTRVYIEQSFGLLKGRFRILKHLNVYNTEFIPKIILACCVLHNICIENGDTSESVELDDNNITEASSCNKKDTDTHAKRDYIASLLNTV